MTWEAAVCTLKTKYHSLKGQTLWTPQVSMKKKDDEIAGLHAVIHKLMVQKTLAVPVAVVEDLAVTTVMRSDISPGTA